MAVTKYPNYLEELLKLKLKESDINSKAKKLPPKHEKFKFSNVSEERLNLAVQLAQKDIMEGYIGHNFIQRKKTKDKDDDCDYQSGTRCTCHAKSRDVTPNYKDLPIRTTSPPIRDENSKPRKSIVTEQEASVELSRSKRDVLRIIRQIQEAASVDVKKRLSKEDPDEADRRKVRVAERSNRIGRLTYDLSRGAKDLLNDIRRGKRQECLKKLLHFYKESLKVLKMVAMQTNDSSDPRSFLRSKIFVDLVDILSDLSFSAVELNVSSSANDEQEPSSELRKILDFSGANGKPRIHFPRSHLPPSVPPPPPSPWSDQDYNNNIIQQQKQMQWLWTNKFPTPVDNLGDVNVNLIKMSNENRRPVSQELPKCRASIPNKVYQESRGSNIVIGNTDQDSRRRLLKKCLLLLMERNLQNGRRMGGGDELRSDKGQAKVKSDQVKTGVFKSRLNNVVRLNKPRKMPPKAHRGAPRTAPTYPVRSILSNHEVCNHETELENMLRRSKSSPPRLSKKVTHDNNEESSAEDKELKRLTPRKVEKHEGRRAPKSPEGHQRSRSLSRRVVCPNCGVHFENQHDFDRLKIVHKSPSSGCRGDSDSDVSGADGGNLFEAFSSLTSSNIRKLDKKLKEFEIERMKIKERWPSGGIENKVLESPTLEVQTASERPWIEDFEKEFRRDVADAKSIFHHLAAGGESLECDRADNFSAKLLHDWNRRDREFFSFQLYNGESHSGDDHITSTTQHCGKSSNKSQGYRTDTLGRFNDGGAYPGDEDRVQLASKLASVALPREPIDLMVNREALSEMLVKTGELKGQVKDGIMRLLNSQSGDGDDNAFLSSRMARDLLEDCLQQVCNEADFVGSEIVNRVYKSELSHDS